MNRRRFLRHGALFVPAMAIVGQAQNLDLSTLTGKVGGGNQLLNGLTAYYKMDEAGGTTRNDSTANALNLTDANADLAQGIGIINGCAVGSQTINSNRLFHAANALYNAGAGVSFSFSGWYKGNGLINDHHILANWGATGSYLLFYSSGPASIQWACIENGTHTLRTLNLITGASFGTANFFHFVFGFDNPNQVIWYQVNNGTRTTTACAGVNLENNEFAVFNISSGTTPQQILVDELGFWRKVLTPSDVANLYNLGNALPYSKFTT